MSDQPLLYSRLGRYALRTAAILAGCDERIAGKALAAHTGIPVAYQSKVLRRLVEAGILSAQKGHYGGFALARPPETITLAAVLAAAEALPSGGACVFDWGPCSAVGPCPLHHTWSELSKQVIDWTEETTLADIGPPPGLDLLDA